MVISHDIKKQLKISNNSFVNNIENLLSSLDSKKEWILEERDFSGGGYIKNNQSYKCSLKRLLLATGIAMTNVNSSDNIEAHYAILRHANSFSKNKELLFKERLDTEDWRKKAIYSEEIGVGASICILGDIYDVRFISDASFFLKKIIKNKDNPYYGLGLNSRDIYGENGKYSPDFFCLTNSRRAVVAESKGVMGFYSKLENPLKKGKKQVKNVTPTGVSLRSNASKLVFATQIPLENVNTRSKPHTVILDPEEKDSIFIEVSNDEIIRQSLAKTLNFMNYNNQAKKWFVPKKLK